MRTACIRAAVLTPLPGALISTLRPDDIKARLEAVAEQLR